MNNSEPIVHRIGEISAATGMTIRTLHYYEEIGLIPRPPAPLQVTVCTVLMHSNSYIA